MAGIVTPLMQTQVAELYVGFFNRAPLAAGMSYWADKLAAGATPQQLLANEIQFTPEYVNLYAGFTPEQQVTTFFRHVFGRDPLAAGVTYWASKVTATNPFYNVAWDMVSSVYAGAPGVNPADTALVQNKVAVSKFYAIDLHGTDRATADTAFYGVTQDPATVTAKEAEMAQSSGGTFTLTTSADNVNAAGNVLVTGTGDSTPTLQAIDTITGNGSNDTMRITYTATNTDATNGALISGVENFQIRNSGVNAAGATNTLVSLDASKDVGLTNAQSYLSTGNVAVTNLATGAKLSIEGNGTLVNGGLTGTYKTATNAVTLDLNNGVNQVAGNAVAATTGGGGVAGRGVIVTGSATSATINSNGATANATGQLSLAATGNTLNSVTINAQASLTVAPTAASAGIIGWDAAATAATLTVKGAASATPTGQLAAVNLGDLDAAIDVVDASGLTAGGISAKIGAVAQVITGGQGNDTITTNGVQTGAVNAGAGTGDRLIVSAAADVATAPGAKFTNFEILRNFGGGATLDVSKVTGITSIELGATGQGATNMTAGQAAAVTNLADNNVLTLSLGSPTGTSDVLTVNLTNATATASADLTNATVNGFETVNIVSNSGSFSDVNSFTVAAATDLKNLNFSGAAPISTTAVSSVAVAINASALTAVGTATTQYTFEQSGTLVKGSSVTGSAALDKLSTNTGAITGAAGDYITYSAGAGNDLVVTTVAALNNVAAGNASVKIDGGIGTDTVETNVNTYVDANFQYVTNVEKLTFTGAGTLNVVSGGFFDSNFKTAGVEITAGALGIAGGATAASQVLNLATFTGNAKASLTQAAAAAADVGDSFTVTTGTGNDTVSLTTTETLTSAAQISINTGSGNDTVTLTEAAAGAAGAASIILGAGNDTFTASKSAVSVTGGTGADSMTGGTGVDTYVQTMGDSIAATANTLATTIANGNTITFANSLDKITGFTSGTDKIDADVAGAVTNGVGQLASQVQTTNYAIRGDFLNGVFTASATGADTLVSLGKAASTLTFADATDYVLLVGVTSVAAGDFI